MGDRGFLWIPYTGKNVLHPVCLQLLVPVQKYFPSSTPPFRSLSPLFSGRRAGPSSFQHPKPFFQGCSFSTWKTEWANTHLGRDSILMTPHFWGSRILKSGVFPDCPIMGAHFQDPSLSRSVLFLTLASRV